MNFDSYITKYAQRWCHKLQSYKTKYAQRWCHELQLIWHMARVGQNHTFVGIYGVFTVFLAEKSPYTRSYTVCIYSSGQPYIWHVEQQGAA